ncbi:DUF4326 domain-containing protein [Paracoccus litorisediminis]|uniref:DUF4326 domain-containing protein n=1 Tax=Paracoccus litorisediminis TaxID=2006130 RepID=UPI003733862F
MSDPFAGMVKISGAADLRRGMRLAWAWKDDATRLDAERRGLKPQGRVVTQADYPNIASRLGLVVDGDPDWIADPALMLERGRDLWLISAAEPPEVLNAKLTGKSRANAVYIGRPSNWGNPFSIGKHGDLNVFPAVNRRGFFSSGVDQVAA